MRKEFAHSTRPRAADLFRVIGLSAIKDMQRAVAAALLQIVTITCCDRDNGVSGQRVKEVRDLQSPTKKNVVDVRPA